MNNRLLIDEPPLQVLPTLAVEIGLNEAMFLQQLHFWLGVARRGRTGRTHNGMVWSYKTFEEWQQENFPFWSVSTIKRLVDKLVKSGLILAEKLDSHKRIQTNFYTINYAALKQICDGLENEQCIVSDCTDGECQNDTMEQLNMTRPNVSECDDVYVSTENTTETTTENKKTNKKDDAGASGVCSGSDQTESKTEICKRVIDYLNLKTGSAFRHADSHMRLIASRLKAGATEDELCRVIDRKCLEWLQNPEMRQYLRPGTLFSPKNYDNYVGQLTQPLPNKNLGNSQSSGKFDPTEYINRNRISRQQAQQGATDASFIDI